MVSTAFNRDSITNRSASKDGTMDGLDEKANGTPPMEVDDIVSVRDRKLRRSNVCKGFTLIDFNF